MIIVQLPFDDRSVNKLSIDVRALCSSTMHFDPILKQKKKDEPNESLLYTHNVNKIQMMEMVPIVHRNPISG